MKTRRTQVFKDSVAHLFGPPGYESNLAREHFEYLLKLDACDEAKVVSLHAAFWAMVATEMSQPDAVFLKIV